jgi:hypothetical protein
MNEALNACANASNQIEIPDVDLATAANSDLAEEREPYLAGTDYGTDYAQSSSGEMTRTW